MLHYFNSHSQFWIPQFAFLPVCEPALDTFDGPLGEKVHNRELNTGQDWLNADLSFELDGGGAALQTASGAGVTHPSTTNRCVIDGYYEVNVEFAFIDSSNRTNPGVIVAYTDPSNYIYIEFTRGDPRQDSRFALVEVSGGVESVIEFTNYDGIFWVDEEILNIKIWKIGDLISILVNDSQDDAYFYPPFNATLRHGFSHSYTGSQNSSLFLDWSFDVLEEREPTSIVLHSQTYDHHDMNGDGYIEQDNTIVDYYRGYDGTTYTVQEDGIYYVLAGFQSGGSTTAHQLVLVFNSGTPSEEVYYGSLTPKPDPLITQVSGIYDLSAGDTIDILSVGGVAGGNASYPLNPTSNYLRVIRFQDADIDYKFFGERVAEQVTGQYAAPIEYDNIIINDGSYSSGQFTATDTGLHIINWCARCDTGGNFPFGLFPVLFLNGSRWFCGYMGATSTDYTGQCTSFCRLEAGDVVELRLGTSGGGSQRTMAQAGNEHYNYLQVAYLPNGEQVFYGDRQNTGSGATWTGNIPYPDNVYDPYSGMSSDEYTISESGLYGVSAAIRPNNSPDCQIDLYIDGNLYQRGSYRYSIDINRQIAPSNWVIYLEAGQIVSVRSDVHGRSDDGNIVGSRFSIAKLK